VLFVPGDENAGDILAARIGGRQYFDPVDRVATVKREQGVAAPPLPVGVAAERPSDRQAFGVLPAKTPDRQRRGQQLIPAALDIGEKSLVGQRKLAQRRVFHLRVELDKHREAPHQILARLQPVAVRHNERGTIEHDVLQNAERPHLVRPLGHRAIEDAACQHRIVEVGDPEDGTALEEIATD